MDNTKLTLKQLEAATTLNIKRLVILGEMEIKKVTYSVKHQYANYIVAEISPYMESSYSETFKTMTIESGISLVLVKEG